jgi:hypothetical protein
MNKKYDNNNIIIASRAYFLHEQLLGININFHKSIFFFALAIKKMKLPFTLNCLPVGMARFLSGIWEYLFIIEDLKCCLETCGWETSKEIKRLEKNYYVLVEVKLVWYMISFFQLSKGVLQKLNYLRSRFFW